MATSPARALYFPRIQWRENKALKALAQRKLCITPVSALNRLWYHLIAAKFQNRQYCINTIPAAANDYFHEHFSHAYKPFLRNYHSRSKRRQAFPHCLFSVLTFFSPINFRTCSVLSICAFLTTLSISYTMPRKSQSPQKREDFTPHFTLTY